MVAARPPSPGLTTRVGLATRDATTLTLLSSFTRDPLRVAMPPRFRAAPPRFAMSLRFRAAPPHSTSSRNRMTGLLCVLARTIQFSKNRLPVVRGTPGLLNTATRLSAPIAFWGTF